MSTKKRIVFIIGVVLVFILIFGGGVYFGYSQRPQIEKVTELFNKEQAKPATVDFSPFWSAWNVIREKYVSPDGVDNQKMVYGAIEGMVKSLGDPYSVFFPPQESKTFQEQMAGGFEGVGMEIGVRNNVVTVIAPLKDTPAYRAGIKAGDQILKIDGKDTTDMASDEAASLIRGKGGTSVTLTILPKNATKTKDVTMVRETISIPTLDTEKRADGIFVIKLYNFSENSAQLFQNAMNEFRNSGDKKLILDLRNNPGGYLESAVDIASWFLPEGKVVAQEKFSSGEVNIFRSKGYGNFSGNSLVVLVDGGSASASEILAGALQEQGVTKLVGIKTFGKGSVQELIPVTSDTSLKLTIANWLTPKGKWISKQGLDPDVKVETTDKDTNAGLDPQMDKAVQMLK